MGAINRCKSCLIREMILADLASCHTCCRVGHTCGRFGHTFMHIMPYYAIIWHNLACMPYLCILCHTCAYYAILAAYYATLVHIQSRLRFRAASIPGTRPSQCARACCVRVQQPVKGWHMRPGIGQPSGKSKSWSRSISTWWAGGIWRSSADSGAGQSERYFFVPDARHDPTSYAKNVAPLAAFYPSLLNQGREVCAMRRSPGTSAAHK